MILLSKLYKKILLAERCSKVHLRKGEVDRERGAGTDGSEFQLSVMDSSTY